jgi:hypothetical protein
VSGARPRVAVLAYGSLIGEPGPRLAAMIADRETVTTPFPVEFGRASRRWGDGPVLTVDPRGAPVAGRLLVLHASVGLGDAVMTLAEREGCPPGPAIVQVDLGRPLTVLACALPRNLSRRMIEPDALADRALASLVHGPRNGVAYLAAALEAGIATPRIGPYAEAVLERAGAADLGVSGERLVAFRGDA